MFGGVHLKQDRVSKSATAERGSKFSDGHPFLPEVATEKKGMEREQRRGERAMAAPDHHFRLVCRVEGAGE